MRARTAGESQMAHFSSASATSASASPPPHQQRSSLPVFPSTLPAAGVESEVNQLEKTDTISSFQPVTPAPRTGKVRMGGKANETRKGGEREELKSIRREEAKERPPLVGPRPHTRDLKPKASFKSYGSRRVLSRCRWRKEA
ncbi:hypothetical protein ZHAS_00007531 [Anopheles sinensis]|uniref:Uncharacterized protein n=1 Tax=Anopheles sinensis TaxID=74873 RepID=A0A084VQ25_ANOSI|nr:hypothetical protein ZHAS_00007531 [Anopheles sinensis]